MTLKVLHILDSTNRDGAEMLTLEVCRNAHHAGLDLTFVATGRGIAELLDNPDLRQKMSANNHHLATQFTAKSVATEYTTLYRSIIERDAKK